MELNDWTILMNAAEEICLNKVQPCDILEGSPNTISSGYRKEIYGAGTENPETEETINEEVKPREDVVIMGRATTPWFSLPEDIKKRVDKISVAASALSDGLNKVREYREHQLGKKLKTARTRCEIQQAEDMIFPPSQKEFPDNEDIRLIIKHALTPA